MGIYFPTGLCILKMLVTLYFMVLKDKPRKIAKIEMISVHEDGMNLNSTINELLN